jgi:acyl-coenzyme A synthetase/AMP-(fatty) acid ligase
MIIQLLREKETSKKYDLSSVRFVFSGAAPLGEEVMKEVEQMFPTWNVAQAYGNNLYLPPSMISYLQPQA